MKPLGLSFPTGQWVWTPALLTSGKARDTGPLSHPIWPPCQGHCPGGPGQGLGSVTSGPPAAGFLTLWLPPSSRKKKSGHHGRWDHGPHRCEGQPVPRRNGFTVGIGQSGQGWSVGSPGLHQAGSPCPPLPSSSPPLCHLPPLPGLTGAAELHRSPAGALWVRLVQAVDTLCLPPGPSLAAQGPWDGGGGLLCMGSLLGVLPPSLIAQAHLHGTASGMPALRLCLPAPGGRRGQKVQPVLDYRPACHGWGLSSGTLEGHS